MGPDLTTHSQGIPGAKSIYMYIVYIHAFTYIIVDIFRSDFIYQRFLKWLPDRRGTAQTSAAK